jgi:hypothetical protein
LELARKLTMDKNTIGGKELSSKLLLILKIIFHHDKTK